MSLEIVTTEMHTGGGAVRIVEEGFPELLSPTLLEKRRELLEKHDNIRKCIINEPRGHADLYGAVLVKSELVDADVGVLFIHNQGAGMMCGHAVMALARHASDRGMGRKTGNETLVNIHCPAGLVKVKVLSDSSAVFTMFPTFVVQSAVDLRLNNGQAIKVDVVFCGVFYALFDCTQLYIDIGSCPLSELTALGDEIKKLTEGKVKLVHPNPTTPMFITGTVLHDGVSGGHNSKNLLIFADKQVERSAGGTCVAARLALDYFKGNITSNQPKTFSSAVVAQSSLVGRVIKEDRLVIPGEDVARRSVIVELTGKGYYTGKSKLIIEPDDLLSAAGGFILK